MSKQTRQPKWQRAFLAGLRTGKPVKIAAAGAGITPGTVYARRRTNAQFAAEWTRAWTAGGHVPRSASFTRTTHWKRPFLQALAETSNVKASAKLVNIPTPTVYQVRREDPVFAARWRDALHEGYEHLEMEVLAYLRGNDPERKFDTANAIRLLAAHRQTIAEIRAISGDEDERAILESIDALIDRMRGAKVPDCAEPAAHG